MRINKRIISILTILLCMGVLLSATGCGEPKPTAVESGQFFFNYLIKHDKTGIEKFGITEEQANDMIKAQTDITKNQTRMNFSKAGMLISEEKLDSITEAQYNALKTLDATVEASSESGNETTITVTTPYIDFTGIDTKAANDAQQSVMALGITDEKELTDKFKDQYIENLLAGLKDAKPSSETNKGTYKLKKDSKSGLWVPDMDSQEFGKQLAKLTQQKV